MMTGLPVYLDIERDLIDPIESEPSDRDWQPGNRACQKLFRCVEAVRDLKEVIDNAQEVENATKRRRRLKLLATPLYSFATCIDDLLNDCIGNSDTRSKLSTDQVKTIAEVRTLLSERVPFRKGGMLARLRNKAAAHVDADLSPDDMRRLLKSVPLQQLGFWMDTCVSVFCDVLKLPIYFWTCHCEYPNVIRLLAAEPILASFKLKNNEISEFVGAHVIQRSPRMIVANLVFELIETSRWMFGANDPQIRSFYYDDKDSHWAQSLSNLRATAAND
jgi:hypothetical protein